MKSTPRNIALLLLLLAIALFAAYRLSRPPEMPKVAPGTNARTEDAPDH